MIGKTVSGSQRHISEWDNYSPKAPKDQVQGNSRIISFFDLRLIREGSDAASSQRSSEDEPKFTPLSSKERDREEYQTREERRKVYGGSPTAEGGGGGIRS